jgi:hypothetical protein
MTCVHVAFGLIKPESKAPFSAVKLRPFFRSGVVSEFVTRIVVPAGIRSWSPGA